MTARDDAWMEGLIGRHHGRVRRYVAMRLPAGEVDDAVAEVFAAAWKDRQQVPDQALPWLLACARLRVLNSAAARHTGRHLAERVQAQSHIAQQPAPDLGWIWTVLDQLDTDEREVLCLAAWEGLSSVELGQVLGCSAVNARVRLFRARRHAEQVIAAGRCGPQPTPPRVGASAPDPTTHRSRPARSPRATQSTNPDEVTA